MNFRGVRYLKTRENYRRDRFSGCSKPIQKVKLSM